MTETVVTRATRKAQPVAGDDRTVTRREKDERWQIVEQLWTAAK